MFYMFSNLHSDSLNKDFTYSQIRLNNVILGKVVQSWFSINPKLKFNTLF